MKRTILYVVLGATLVVAVIGVVGWRSRAAQRSEEEVRSTVVKRGTMLVAVSASGSVEPQARAGLAFEVPGRVADVPVEVGDAVEAGDVLARLDSDQLALQIQQSRAALASAEAQLTQLRAGARPEEIEAAEANLRALEAQVSGAAASLDQLEAGVSDAQIAAAEAELASASLQQKVAQIAYDRIDKKDRDRKEQARYNLYAADEALAAAQARLDELLAGADADQIRAAQANVWAAVAQRDAVQGQLDLLAAGATDEQIAAAEARVAQAQSALELAELSLEQATLRAPFDGLVAELNVTAGEQASAGLPAVTLVDISGFHVSVSVDEMDVGRLAEGQTAQVTLEALPDVEITGAVERIAPAATFDGGVVSYEVIIRLAPTGAPIRADMTANATVVVEELADVLMIPTWVVRVDRNTGQTYVHRRAGDDFERVDVELGVRHEGFAQVLEGLSEGDVVVWMSDSAPFGFQR
jgi:HlyD family secretion protein